MKLLSIVIPCFNSQEYMRYCIESLLPGREDVELIIVDDGSTDKTGEIADEYGKIYPTVIKVIHQENGGHGEAINIGIKNSSGFYLKVVDSDDWVDTRAYLKILEALKGFVSCNQSVDMIVSNFTYEKESSKFKKVMKYVNVFPEGKSFTWDDIAKFSKSQYILMHSVIYRTQLLIDCGLELPKHTYYVDNLFVYTPLAYVKRLYYINVDFYRYFIGRQDQSVNEAIMIKRLDQQIKVNMEMIKIILNVTRENHKLYSYMLHYLELVTLVSSTLLIRSGKVENFKKKKELWNSIKRMDKNLYYWLRYRFSGRLINLPGFIGNGITILAYKMAQRIIGFS